MAEKKVEEKKPKQKETTEHKIIIPGLREFAGNLRKYGRAKLKIPEFKK